MLAIVDCNSFYCSCERVFRPDLRRKPVVVLSNNDGCIISRSDEARNLGVGMAVAYHENKDLIQSNGIEVFSSNYILYGDMSRRVMDTLRFIAGPQQVEVYSVDEAFLNLDHISPRQLLQHAHAIRDTVEQWTGIEVSIGVAPTKTLAKLANRLAKNDKLKTQCVTLLDTPEKIAAALQSTSVKDIWGIGRRQGDKLERLGIRTAWQLRNMNEAWVRSNLGGVTGVRLLQELCGNPAIGLEEPLETKKMITTTRMFGNPVTALSDIKEAIATYTSRAAEKLRRQYCAANVISIFVVRKQSGNDSEDQLQALEAERERWGYSHGPTVSAYTLLPTATSLTHELIKPAMMLAERIYKKGERYKKAGVMLSGLVPDGSIQANLFAAPEKNAHRMLMNMVDNINFSMRDDTLKFASSGTERNWKMRQELRSPRFTTRWEELKLVR
ncbi:MAG TPA: Y-family DNA polymerase [Chitinophagaceae bacterium]|nr:Y-family DNA polymerase [Chitinophagaceae bacterium]